MRLQDLLVALEQPPTQIYGADRFSPLSDISAIAYDSRKVTEGGLFVAVPGVHTDGRRFLRDAQERGAITALGAPLQDAHELPLPYIEVADVRTALANLALQRVYGCEFDVGVVTNITHEHLDFHKTLDAYRRAKARLFEMLDPERDKGLASHPIAILNRDDV